MRQIIVPFGTFTPQTALESGGRAGRGGIRRNRGTRSLRLAVTLLVSTALVGVSSPALAGIYVDGTSVVVDGVTGGPYGTAMDGGNFVTVGALAAGTLTLQNGGTATGEIGNVGALKDGTATITGAGSRWFGVGTYRVGSTDGSNGTLNIAAGGEAQGTRMDVGVKAGASGTVNISDSDSKLNLGGDLVIGAAGTGAVNASGRATVRVGRTLIGQAGSSTGTVTVSGAGTTWLNLGGSMRVGQDGTGTLTIKDGAAVTAANLVEIGSRGTLNIGAAAGEVAAAAGGLVTDEVAFGAGTGMLVFNHTDPNHVFSSDITGAGHIEVRGGTTILTGTTSYSGGTLVEGGTLRAGATAAFSQGTAYRVNGGTLDLNGHDLEMSELSGTGGLIDLGAGSLTLNQTTDTSFAGVLSGTGSFRFEGGGRLTLSGVHGHTGGTEVRGGTLVVNGTLGAIDVLSGGRLAGTGTVGNARVAGTITAGNSIGTLNVAGDLSFDAGGAYEVEVSGAGTTPGVHNDFLNVAGGVTIDNGADVFVRPEIVGEDGSGYNTMNVYTILSAGGGITGRFGAVSDNFAFLDSHLDYDAENVYLILVRNDVDFAAVAQTENQKAAAGGLGSLSTSRDLYRQLLGTYAAEAPKVFDQLSGEIHGSVNGYLLAQPKQVEGKVLSRIDAAFAARPARGGKVFWLSALGGIGRLDGDGNAHSLDVRSGGLLIGADVTLESDWLVGMAGGFMRSSLEARGVSSTADTDSFYLAGYGGKRFGSLGLRFGGSYGHHSVSTSRTARFGGTVEQLKADYSARTLQAFAETGWRIGEESAHLEPFARVSYVNLLTNGFSETGGVAALHATSQTQDAVGTTLGVRVGHDIEIGGIGTRLSGHLGWQHAFGALNATSSMAFDGSNVFTVVGAPRARNAALFGINAPFALSPDAEVSLGYNGQVGGGVNDHSLDMRVQVRF